MRGKKPHKREQSNRTERGRIERKISRGDGLRGAVSRILLWPVAGCPKPELTSFPGEEDAWGFVERQARSRALYSGRNAWDAAERGPSSTMTVFECECGNWHVDLVHASE